MPGDNMSQQAPAVTAADLRARYEAAIASMTHEQRLAMSWRVMATSPMQLPVADVERRLQRVFEFEADGLNGGAGLPATSARCA